MPQDNPYAQALAEKAGLEPQFADALTKLLARARAEGITLTVTEAKRSLESQARKRKLYESGKGPLAARPKPTAPHVSGRAADLDGDLVWAHRVAPEYGLHFPLLNKPKGSREYEPWHIQLRDGGAPVEQANPYAQALDKYRNTSYGSQDTKSKPKVEPPKREYYYGSQDMVPQKPAPKVGQKQGPPADPIAQLFQRATEKPLAGFMEQVEEAKKQQASRPAGKKVNAFARSVVAGVAAGGAGVQQPDPNWKRATRDQLYEYAHSNQVRPSKWSKPQPSVPYKITYGGRDHVFQVSPRDFEILKSMEGPQYRPDMTFENVRKGGKQIVDQMAEQMAGNAERMAQSVADFVTRPDVNTNPNSLESKAGKYVNPVVKGATRGVLALPQAVLIPGQLATSDDVAGTSRDLIEGLLSGINPVGSADLQSGIDWSNPWPEVNKRIGKWFYDPDLTLDQRAERAVLLIGALAGAGHTVKKIKGKVDAAKSLVETLRKRGVEPKLAQEIVKTADSVPPPVSGHDNLSVGDTKGIVAPPKARAKPKAKVEPPVVDPGPVVETHSGLGFEPQSPQMRRYAKAKEENPNVLLLQRVGDFYEAYGIDAEILAKQLEITLTGRMDGDARVPMAGVPYHSVEKYLAKLLQKGYKVALADEVASPKAATPATPPATKPKKTIKEFIDDAEEALPGSEKEFRNVAKLVQDRYGDTPKARLALDILLEHDVTSPAKAKEVLDQLDRAPKGTRLRSKDHGTDYEARSWVYAGSEPGFGEWKSKMESVTDSARLESRKVRSHDWYHGTSIENAGKIEAEGFRFPGSESSYVGDPQVAGVHLTRHFDDYGDTLQGADTVLKTLVDVHDTYHTTFDDLNDLGATPKARANWLRKRDYDSVLIKGRGGEEELIVLDPQKVTVTGRHKFEDLPEPEGARKATPAELEQFEKAKAEVKPIEPAVPPKVEPKAKKPKKAPPVKAVKPGERNYAGAKLTVHGPGDVPKSIYTGPPEGAKRPKEAVVDPEGHVVGFHEDPARAEQAKFYRDGKLDSNGFTERQRQFIGEKATEAFQQFLDGEGDPKAKVHIDVPGDGTFDIQNQALAWFHRTVTGKPARVTADGKTYLIEEFGNRKTWKQESEWTGKPDTTVKMPAKPTDGGVIEKSNQLKPTAKKAYLLPDRPEFGGRSVAAIPKWKNGRIEEIALLDQETGHPLAVVRQEHTKSELSDKVVEALGRKGVKLDEFVRRDMAGDTIPDVEKPKSKGGGGGVDMPLMDPAGIDRPVKPTARIPASPKPGKVKPLKEITLDISKALNRKVITGKPSPRAIGTYFPRSTASVVKFSGDLDVTAHELAHALDDRFNLVGDFRGKRQKSPWDSELRQDIFQQTTRPSYKLHQKRAEGVAEFLRAWVMDPEKAESLAPNFWKHVQSKVPPEVIGAIRSFSDDVRAWANASAHEQVMSNVRWTPPDNGLLRWITGGRSGPGFHITWADKAQAAIQDHLKAFTKAVDYARGVRGIDKMLPADDPVVLARLYNGIHSKLDNVFEHGMIDAKGKRVTDGFQKMFELLDHSSTKALDREIQEVASYMIAQRTLERGKRTGIGAGIEADVTVAKRRVDEVAQNPGRKHIYDQVAKGYRDWADATLRYLVDKGRMSEELYKAIKDKNEYYVALQRVLEISPDEEIVSINKRAGGRALGTVSTPVHKFKGSSREIENPFTSLMDATYTAIREADRNDAMVQFRDLLTNPRGMYEGSVAELASVGRRAKTGEKNTISIFVKGKREVWQFDSDVYKALKNLETGLYRVPAIFTLLPRVLRSTIVNMPQFATRNVIKDTIHRTLVTETDSTVGGSFKGWKPEELSDLQVAGGDQAGHWMRDRVSYNKKLKQAIRDSVSDRKSVVVDPAKVARAGAKGYLDLIQGSERVGRVAEYKSAFRKAKDEFGYDDYNAQLYAASQARGLLDFAVSGEVVSFVNQLIPFTNAHVQGLTRTLKGARKNPRQFVTKYVVTMAMPSLLAYMWNRYRGAEEEYDQLPATQKDFFWNIKVDDGWVRIPKPYELGAISSWAERRVRHFFGGEEHATEGGEGSLLKAFVSVDESALAGPLEGPVQAMMNYDLFRGKPIVPRYEDDLKLGLRHTERGSRLGQLFGALKLDSRKADFLFRENLGILGSTLTQLSDTGRADKKTMKPADFLGTTAPSPVASARDVQWVMDYARENGIESKAQPLKKLLDLYYDAKTDELRERRGEFVRRQAIRMRKLWEANPPKAKVKKPDL